MNAATEFVSKVSGLGIELRSDGHNIHIEAPEGVVTNELIEELKRHKEELLRLEMWSFRKLEIPSQMRRGHVDVWMVGERLDREQTFRFWYVGQKPDSNPIRT